MSQVLREREIGMLTAGMSTRAVGRKLNVNFSTISHLRRRFREFGSTSNRPHNRRPHCNHASPGPPHPASSPEGSSETVYISVYNKAPLWGKTNSDFLGMAPKWPFQAHPWLRPAQSCKIHWLGPNLFISIDWYPYMNCNSVKSLKLLHVAFIFLFSIFYNIDVKPVGECS